MVKEYVVIPDLHVPFHDKFFIKLVSSAISKIKPQGLVQLGDGLDFWQISRYEKDPARKDSIFEDIAIYFEILHAWCKLLPKGAEVHLLEGNHENRLTRYIWSQAKEIHQIVKKMPELLRLKELEKTFGVKAVWHSYSRWDSCQLGDCVLHHGHYFNQHVAASNLTRYPKKLITGHTHRFQYCTDGEKFSVSLGHGSNTYETMHTPVPSNWQQSFGILRVMNSVSYFEPILVFDGKMIFFGELIDASRPERKKTS